jgi:hypothetical protein
MARRPCIDRSEFYVSTYSQPLADSGTWALLMTAGTRIRIQLSNSDRGKPLCRMIDESVPDAISRWSGTGTVHVLPSRNACRIM